MEISALSQAVAHVLAPILPPEAGLDAAAVAGLLEAPPDRKLGDFAFPCFRLAKVLRNAPAKIAPELSDKVPTDGLVVKVTAAGPYINLRLRDQAIASMTLPRLARGLGEPARSRDSKVMVEYSQPNTHKPFHVGHMRNLCLGDALVRLLRADGYEVVAANYLGDVGAHIAKCLWWYLDHLDDASRVPPDEARGEWLGKLYASASNHLDDLADRSKAGDTAATEELEAAKARTTEILLKLESRDPQLTEVWAETRKWSIDEFDEIYAWTKVEFDRVFYESEVDAPGLAIVQEFFDKGVFVQSEGAVGIFNEEVKHMPFFMLRKRDGTGLYATKDLALARLKFDEHGIDRSIYVVDTRQSDHFRHVFLTLAKMGFHQAKDCQHVPYEVVELPDGPMATRKGNVILFRQLRESMLSVLETKYLGKFRGQWPDEEIEQTKQELALGAIKYGMLNRDVNQKIVFDLEAWLNVEGNTGPYLQYTCARATSILRKAAGRGKGLTADIHDDVGLESILGTLTHPAERDVVLWLDGLEVAVHQSARSLRPSILCTYLNNLARAFNRFVHAPDCNVINSEGAQLQARLVFVTAVQQALRWGLWRLGIPTPERV